jgi:hypothetical protein
LYISPQGRRSGNTERFRGKTSGNVTRRGGSTQEKEDEFALKNGQRNAQINCNIETRERKSLGDLQKNH